MALDKTDLELLGQFIENKVKDLVTDVAPAAAPEPVDRASQVGVPDVAPDAGPEFWLHLADGEVVRSHDSASTHIAAADGSSVQVIGRYQIGG